MVVYWSVLPPNFDYSPVISNDEFFIRFKEPQPLYDSFKEINTEDLAPNSNFKYCPALRDLCKNTFRLQFPFDYKLNFSDGVRSDLYDQKFFDTFVSVRHPPIRNYSLNLSYIFIAEKSLEIELTGCHFSDNDFANKTKMFPGKMNIGKWFRPLDCSFILKDNVTDLQLNRGDDYSYVKFLTDEPIEFKKFHPTEVISQIAVGNMNSRRYKLKPIEKLTYYYDLYKNAKYHNYLLKEIKNNLME